MPKLLLMMHFYSVTESRRVRGDPSLQKIESYSPTGLGAPQPVLNIDVTLNLPSEVSWFDIEKTLLRTASTRYTTSRGAVSAAGWISRKFKTIGLDVSEDEFMVNGTRATNIIGVRTGQTTDCVLLGAHYDTLPAEGVAPGADDNGSGVSSLISVAESLKGAGEFLRCVVFAAFAGEEQEMMGSRNFVKNWRNNYVIRNSIILDQNGNPGNSSGIILESVGRSNSTDTLIDTIAASIESPVKSVEVNYNGFGSDHVSFAEAGIPSVLVIERDNMELSAEYGHTANDRIENINPKFGSAIARIVTNAVMKLAMV